VERTKGGGERRARKKRKARAGRRGA